jgi:hypothetical protein
MAGHELIVALGPWRYRVERPFGAWARNAGFVSDVVVMADATLRVLLRHDPLVEPADARVIELDAAGRQTGGLGGSEIADSHLMTPGRDGTLLVVDRDMHEVIILDRSGRRIGSLGQRGVPLSPFNHPSDVAVAPSGEIYVSDGYAATRVHRFSADGRLIGGWGTLGEGPGQFGEPHALWALADGRIAVVDRVCNRVQVFDAAGRFLAQWGGFHRPVAIWGDAADNIFVIDQTPCLHLFSSAGERLGRCRPVLNGAHGIFGAPNGDLFLAESSPSRVTRLVRL